MARRVSSERAENVLFNACMVTAAVTELNSSVTVPNLSVRTSGVTMAAEARARVSFAQVQANSTVSFSTALAMKPATVWTRRSGRHALVIDQPVGAADRRRPP